jgi:anti-anti-sigma factor
MIRGTLTLEVVSPSGDVAAVTIVRFRGVLDANSATDARATLARAAAEARGTFVFDLEELAFLDSMGIGALLETQIALKRRGDRVFLTNVQRPVRRVLEVVRALPSDTIFDSREALDAYLKAVQEGEGRG